MHQIKAVFNGNFDYIENIKVSPFSRAYTFSDSVYEVIPFYNKQFISFESHIERLQRSVDALSINPDVKKVTTEINQLLSSSSFDNGYVYYQVTRGEDFLRSHMYSEHMNTETFGYITPSYMNFIKFHSLQKLISLQKNVYELDLTSKGLSKKNFWDDLDRMIISMTTN